MPGDHAWHERLRADSYLEAAFLRWVLAPACLPAIAERVTPQREVEVAGRRYRIDYEIAGSEEVVDVELDGYGFHGDRPAFTYDRLRQNDLASTGRILVRFSYDSIRLETARCVAQLQAVLRLDRLLGGLLVPDPVVERADMEPDLMHAIQPPGRATLTTYFDDARQRISSKTLRECQREAMGALLDYYRKGGTSAACVMSVGAGKTALGVTACLAFARRRAMVITPGRVIRGTFDLAFDHEAVRNVLYGLPGGPLIPGCPPPKVMTLDADEGPIRSVTREQLLGKDVILTNFHRWGPRTTPTPCSPSSSPTTSTSSSWTRRTSRLPSPTGGPSAISRAPGPC